MEVVPYRYILYEPEARLTVLVAVTVGPLPLLDASVRVQDDLRRILGSSDFFLDTSALPSYVNAQYLNDLQKAIGEKVNNLTPAQFEQCPIASFGYDIWEDSFTVAIVGLDSNKISLFKQWVSDWGYFSFETASEIPKPKT